MRKRVIWKNVAIHSTVALAYSIATATLLHLVVGQTASLVLTCVGGLYFGNRMAGWFPWSAPKGVK